MYLTSINFTVQVYALHSEHDVSFIGVSWCIHIYCTCMCVIIKKLATQSPLSGIDVCAKNKVPVDVAVP